MTYTCKTLEAKGQTLEGNSCIVFNNGCSTPQTKKKKNVFDHNYIRSHLFWQLLTILDVYEEMYKLHINKTTLLPTMKSMAIPIVTQNCPHTGSVLYVS